MADYLVALMDHMWAVMRVAYWAVHWAAQTVVERAGQMVARLVAWTDVWMVANSADYLAAQKVREWVAKMAAPLVEHSVD